VTEQSTTSGMGNNGETGESLRGAWLPRGQLAGDPPPEPRGPSLPEIPIRTQAEIVAEIVAFNVAVLHKRLTKIAGAPLVQYPAHALGPLAGVCEAMSEMGQVSTALAGQTLLAATSVLTQSMFNAQGLVGAGSPLSTFHLTMAASGEGKSTAEGVALKPIREYQRKAANAHGSTLGQATSRRSRELGDVPREPYILVSDATIEGLRTSFARGRASQGLFTAEGGTWLGGYGMTADQRTKTAAALNELWDDGRISVVRAGPGRIELYDRRFAMSVLVQPDVGNASVHDPGLVAIGLWPRFVFEIAPESKPRRAMPFRPEEHAAIRNYWDRCCELLAVPVGSDCSELSVLKFTREAQTVLASFFERADHLAKTPGAAFETIRPFAMRATEQVVRIAGVLAAFNGDTQIDDDMARNAITLVLHSLDNWLAVSGAREGTEGHIEARTLYAWLLKQNDRTANVADILNRGHRSVRSKERRDLALDVLRSVGAVSFGAGGKTVTANFLTGLNE
jgi:hypothetical protein